MTNSLLALERTSLVLGIVMTIATGVFWGVRDALAVGLGAGLSVANLRAIRWLSTRAVQAMESGDRRATASLVGGLVLKMGLLFILVWGALRAFDLPLLPFAFGLSVFVFSLLVWGVWSSLFQGQGAF